MRPDDTEELLALRIGITNLVNRTTATAAELARAELREGGARLVQTIDRKRPAAVGVLGVTAYRAAFASPGAKVGRQPDALAGAILWVLPNPSGLNAHYQLPALVALFRQFREDIGFEAPA
jgi:TDG/mug DNA glycosylase family protein